MTYLRHGNDPEYYFKQTNNIIELIDEKPLRYCMPSALVNLVAGIEHETRVTTPGGYEIQPEDALSIWFRDPENFCLMTDYYDEVDPSDPNIVQWGIPQWAVPALEYVFEVGAVYYGKLERQMIKGFVEKNIGVLKLLIEPSHYIAVTGVSDTHVAYNDPWPGNPWPKALRGRSGFNRIINWEVLEENSYSLGVAVVD